MTLKDRIKELCTAQGINLPKLEELLGFGNSTIVKWDKSSPSLSKIKKVAEYFNISVGELLGETEQKEKPANNNVDELDLTDNEVKLILWLRSLPPEMKEAVLNIPNGSQTPGNLPESK